MESLQQWYAWTGEFVFVMGETPLSDWRVIVAASALYLAIIFPLRYLTPKPVKFVTIQAMHNLFLAGLSLVMLVMTLVEVVLRSQGGATLFDMFCDVGGHQARGRLVFWAWVFHLSKIYEFLDTVFIALRHGELQFLHVYHHILTLFVTWVGLYGEATFQWAGVVTNTFVHTFMYYYYFKVTYGWTAWWKVYLTQLQIVQFWFNTFCLVMWLVVKLWLGYECKADTRVILLTIFANVTFYLLFQQFYNRTYKSRGVEKQGNGKDGQKAGAPKSTKAE